MSHGAAVVAVVLIALASAAYAGPTLEDQVYAIAHDLMCPVCAGQTVAESNSALAGQMREIIRERLQQGQTRQEIIAYFVAQFGEGVLAAPPRRGGALLLWLSPPVALLAGLFVLSRYLARHRARAQPPVPRPTPQEAEQIQRELRDLD
jgi:cytochrome c-type biogenesis protein CcmH